MKKTYTIKIVFFLVLILFGFYGWGQDSKKQDSTKSVVEKNTIPADWKTYTNDKYGFTFKYPSDWSKYGEEMDVVDPSGKIIKTKINFVNKISQTTFLIEYYLPPNGKERYTRVVSQFKLSEGDYKTGAIETVVAGNKAIEAFRKIIDIEEHTDYSPKRLIVVDFLDKLKLGEFRLQFNTSIDNDIEVAKFKQLIFTFKFTD